MNHKLLTLTLLTLPCLASELITHAPTPEDTLMLSTIGGVQSLCRAKDDTTEIVVIGHTASEGFTVNTFTGGDNQAKGWIIPQLELFSQLKSPTALVTFVDEQTCMEHAKLWGEKDKKDASFYVPLMAEIHALAFLTKDDKHGNLHILCRTHKVDYEELLWDVSIIFNARLFPTIAQRAKLGFNDVLSLNTYLVQSSPEEQKRFFGKGGTFEQFQQEAQKALTKISSVEVSINQLFGLVDSARQEAEELCATSTNPYLIKELKKAIHHLKKARAEASTYLATYGITEHNIGLLKALCTIITAEREISQTTLTFIKELYFPLVEVLDLLKYASTITTTYSQVVVLYPYDKMYKFLSFLKASGYDLEVKGIVPNIQAGEKFMLQHSPFSQTDVVSFLQQSFGAKASLHLPEISEESPVHALMQEHHRLTALQDILSVCRQEENPQPKPVVIVTHEDELACRFCTHKVDQTNAQLSQTCSYECLVRHLFLKKSKALKNLLEKETLNQEDQAVLAHLGALCYLRAFTLSPLMSLPPVPFDLKKVLEALTKLKDATKDKASARALDQGWKRALAIAKPLGIEVGHLQSSLAIYQGLHTTLLKQRIQKTNAVFDPADSLKKLQSGRTKQLGQLFKLDAQPPRWYPRVYYSLMHTIGFEPTQLEKALKVNLKKGHK